MADSLIIDYRNARYHGQIYRDAHNGLGIFLDQNLLFVLSQWKNNQIEGDSFVIFPNHIFFYGQIIKNKQQGNECYLIGMFKHGRAIENQVFIDFRQINELYSIESTKDQRSLQLKQQFIYNTQQQQESLYRKFLGIQYKQSKYATYHSFIQSLSKKHKKHIIELINGNEWFISFPLPKISAQDDLIIGSMLKNSKVSSLGLFDKNRNLKNVGLKVFNGLGGSIFQEGDFTQKIVKYQKQRPRSITKIYNNFFCRSMYFVNIYRVINLNQIWNFSLNISENIKDLKTQKYAQILLENPKLNAIIVDTAAIQKKPQSIIKSTQPLTNRPNRQDFSLQQIKQQVLRAASKRKNSKISSKDLKNAYQYSTPPKIVVKDARQNLNININSDKYHKQPSYVTPMDKLNNYYKDNVSFEQRRASKSPIQNRYKYFTGNRNNQREKSKSKDCIKYQKTLPTNNFVDNKLNKYEDDYEKYVEKQTQHHTPNKRSGCKSNKKQLEDSLEQYENFSFKNKQPINPLPLDQQHLYKYQSKKSITQQAIQNKNKNSPVSKVSKNQFFTPSPKPTSPEKRGYVDYGKQMKKVNFTDTNQKLKKYDKYLNHNNAEKSKSKSKQKEGSSYKPRRAYKYYYEEQYL